MEYENRFKMPGIEEQHAFTAAVVLDKMIAKKRPFSALTEGDDTFIDDCLSFLSTKGILDTDVDKGEYVPSHKGKQLYNNMVKKYQEYVKLYDIYCAVDIEEGSFGFEKIFDYSDDVFQDYIHDDRFLDLRVTVAEFKKMNCYEIVFMAFLMEKRFREPRDRSNVMGKDSWQYKCSSGEIFQEIVEICNRAPHFEELGFEDDQGSVSGEDVIRDIIDQGTQLARKIHEQQLQEEREQQRGRFEEDDMEPEVVTTTTYSDPYYYDPYWHDPYYVSPVWDIALLGIILL